MEMMRRSCVLSAFLMLCIGVSAITAKENVSKDFLERLQDGRVRILQASTGVDGRFRMRSTHSDTKFFCANMRGQEGYNKVSIEDMLMTKSGECAELAGATLSGRNMKVFDLRVAHLEGADLTGAILQRADLKGARLQRASLKGADMRMTMLRGALFNEADASGADFSGSTTGDYGDFRKAVFVKAKLRDGNYWSADFREAVMKGADLSGAYFQHSNFNGADMKEADVAHADMRHITAEGADFSGADANGTKFDSSSLEGANMSGASMVGTRFIGSNLRGVNLIGTYMIGAHLDAADLTGAIYSASTNWRDAQYTSRTILPFSESEAMARGMIRAGN